MEWSKEKTLILIDEYRSRRGLWDMTHEDYRKKEVKRVLLDEVSQKFDRLVPAVEIEKKFHTLRTQYHREINRMNQIRGNEPYKSKWFAFKHLQFLSSPKACRGGKVSVKVKLEEISPPEVTLSVVDEHAASYIFKEEQITVQNYNAQNHNSNSEVAEKSSCSSEVICPTNGKVILDSVENRKDLDALFQDTSKHVEQNDAKIVVKEISIPVPTPTKTITESHYDEYEEEQHVSEHNSDQIIDDSPSGGSYQHSGKILKTTSQKRDQVYEEVVYEDDNQNQPSPMKKMYIEKIPLRDEHSIYGEYVANEMRFITSRDILTTLKHKINIALYEANMAQLQKSS